MHRALKQAIFIIFIYLFMFWLPLLCSESHYCLLLVFFHCLGLISSLFFSKWISRCTGYRTRPNNKTMQWFGNWHTWAIQCKCISDWEIGLFKTMCLYYLTRPIAITKGLNTCMQLTAIDCVIWNEIYSFFNVKIRYKDKVFCWSFRRANKIYIQMFKLFRWLFFYFSNLF